MTKKGATTPDDDLINLMRNNKVNSRTKKDIYEARASSTGRASPAPRGKTTATSGTSTRSSAPRTTAKTTTKAPTVRPKKRKPKPKEKGFFETLFGPSPSKKKKTTKRRTTNRASVSKPIKQRNEPVTRTTKVEKEPVERASRAKKPEVASSKMPRNTKERERIRRVIDNIYTEMPDGGETTGEMYAKPESKVLLVTRKEITRHNIQNVLTFLKSWERFHDEARQSLSIEFPDYADLAIPYWALAEVRSFMSVLITKFPHIFYFIKINSMTDIVSSLIILSSNSTGDEIEGLPYTKKKTGIEAQLNDINRMISDDQLELLLGAVADYGLAVKDQKGAKKVNDDILKLFFGDKVDI
jgi:hypothetical protein